MPTNTEVFELSQKHISNILDRNKVLTNDYRFTQIAHENYLFLVNYRYVFKYDERRQTVAGGSPMQGRHYTASGHASTRQTFIQYAVNPTEEKEDFISRANGKIVTLFRENRKLLVWTAPTISHSYDCSTCGGSGKVRCYACHGVGRTTCISCGGSGHTQSTEYGTDSNGNSRSHTVQNGCGSCRQTGKVTCYSCNGSGNVACSSCSGNGYFTDYCTITSIATPSTHYHAEHGLHANAVVEHFISRKNDYLCSAMSLQKLSGNWLDDGGYRFNFQAEVCVVEESITVKGKEFTEIVVNTVPGILFPPIFDHVLKTPHQQIANIADQKRPKRAHVLSTYHKIKDHHAVHHAIQAYSAAGDAKVAEKTAAAHQQILGLTGGYISNGFSYGLAEGVVKLMSRLAPHTTAWPWWLAALALIGLEWMIAMHLGMSYFFLNLQLQNYMVLFWPVLLVESLFLVVAATPTAMVNWGVTRLRQRGVPAMHRPKVYHRKPVMHVIGVLVAAWILMLGAMAVLYKSFSKLYIPMHHYGFNAYHWLEKTTEWPQIIHVVILFLGPKVGAFIQYIHRNDRWSDPVLWVFILAGIILYFIPTIVARLRRRKKVGLYFMGNLVLPLLGGFPWLILLFFAFW
jgi:hypothetical protein